METKPTSIKFLEDKLTMVQLWLYQDEMSKDEADIFLSRFVEEAEEMYKKEIDDAYFAGWDAFAKRNPIKLSPLQKKQEIEL